MTKKDRYYIVQDKLNSEVKKLNQDPNRKIEEYEIIKTSLLAKYTKSIKAIYLLDTYGFFEDAKIILRSIFELFVVLLYCERDVLLYNRYKEYRYIVLNGYLENLDNESKNKVLPEAIENINYEIRKFVEKYYDGNSKKIDKNNWNGISFYKTVKAISEIYKDNEILTYYDVIYKLNCEYVHSDYNSIINSYLEYNFDSLNVIISSNPEPDENYIDLINKVEALTDKLFVYIS